MKFSLQSRDNQGYSKVEVYHEENILKMAEHYREIIKLLGEDTEREGLIQSPVRISKAMQFLTQGYNMDPDEILKSAMFKEDYRQMVIVKDIEIYSLCEHHLLPFFGKAYVAYIPNGYITGLSKIARVVEAFSRRLQVQERLTVQIGKELERILQTESVGVVMDANHMCVAMRGVGDTNSKTGTAYFSGKFRDENTKREFLNFINSRQSLL